jgi:hypothetical protein
MDLYILNLFLTILLLSSVLAGTITGYVRQPLQKEDAILHVFNDPDFTSKHCVLPHFDNDGQWVRFSEFLLIIKNTLENPNNCDQKALLLFDYKLDDPIILIVAKIGDIHYHGCYFYQDRVLTSMLSDGEIIVNIGQKGFRAHIDDALLLAILVDPSIVDISAQPIRNCLYNYIVRSVAHHPNIQDLINAIEKSYPYIGLSIMYALSSPEMPNYEGIRVSVVPWITENAMFAVQIDINNQTIALVASSRQKLHFQVAGARRR